MTVKGVQYDYAEKVAEKYDYSVLHIRHLARLGKKGDPKGLKGFKHRGRWMINLDDAENKLNMVVKAMENATDEGYESGQRTQQSEDKDYSCLEGL